MEGVPREPSPQQVGNNRGLQPQVELRAWIDPVVEAHGFGPLSQYVEVCWLPTLGPTSTLAYRRLGCWAEAQPEGSEIDDVDLAVSLGLGEGLGRNSLIARSLGRLVRFGVARWDGEALAVRRALAQLPEAHARRLSYSARALHDQLTMGWHEGGEHPRRLA
jgi:hypothetical protein